MTQCETVTMTSDGFAWTFTRARTNMMLLLVSQDTNTDVMQAWQQ